MALLAFIALLVGSCSAQLRAQTLTTLYTFADATDGALPGGVIAGPSDGLYGFAGYGGNADCGNQLPPYGCGTVFQLTAGANFTTLYAFNGVLDGQQPSSLINSDNVFYGTTSQGGINDNGTAFALDADGQLQQYDFATGSNATHPFTAMTAARNNAFFGTGYFGGISNYGAIFWLTFNKEISHTERVVYSFQGAPNDGESPNSPVVGDGNILYGTTVYGGPGTCNNGFANGCGTFYKFTAQGETVLHSFTGPDGSYPSKIIPAGNGNFYGVTGAGGAYGAGTIYEITPTGSVTTMFSFNGANGSSPGGLEKDNEGNVFGVTENGGAYGYGTIFELSPDGNGGWQQTLLYSFTGNADGSHPQPPFVLDAVNHNIYGVALEGGNLSCFEPYGCGTVFKLEY